MSIFYDNLQNRFLANSFGTIDNVSDWVGIGGNGYVAFTNILFGSTSIGKALQLGRAVEGVAISFAVGGASPNWAGVINAAAGLAVAAAVIYSAPLTVTWATAGLAASYIAGILAQSVYEAILDTYPNLASDIAGFGDDLVTAIEDAVTDLFDNLRDILDNMDFPNPSDWLFDPLVVDLNGDGVKLTALRDSAANFDFGGDGFRERTGWVSPQDGLLVRDLNGNGLIESVQELFGTQTQDAYTVLRGLDGNGDNKITAADSVWSTLRIWRDVDGDGATDSGELGTLAQHGITEFSLTDQAVRRSEGGNYIYSQATAQVNGQAQATQAVFFGTARNVAIFTPPPGFVPHADTAKLPKLSGGGGTPSLTYSMSLDAGLRTAVQNLMLESSTLSATAFRTRVEAILQDWSGADTAVAGSRGPHIDARWVKMLEAFGGSNYQLTQFNIWRAQELGRIYNQLVDDFTARFMIQSFSSYVALKGAGDPGIATHANRYLSTMMVDPTYNGVWLDRELFMMAVIAGLRRAGGDPVAVNKAGDAIAPLKQATPCGRVGNVLAFAARKRPAEPCPDVAEPLLRAA